MIRANLARAGGLLALAIALAGCEVVGGPAPDVAAPATTVPAAASPILAPTAVPPAPELFAQALAARAVGDDAAAGTALSVLIQSYPDTAEALPARYYLAESFARRGRWTSAAELFRVFLAEAPAASPLRAPALFWVARTNEAAGAHEAAAAAYAEYRALGTPLGAYAAMRQAAQEQALGRTAEAAGNYLHAARGPVVRSERAGSYEKAIALLQAAGRPAEAVDLYAELLDFAQDPGYRARILAEGAALADSIGRADAARAWRAEIVQSLPESAQAAPAADALLAAADPAVTPALAGRIFLAAERWPEAVAQLDAAIAAEADPEAGADLRRLRGLALRAQGDFPAALAALAEAAALSPDGDRGRQARLDAIQTLGQSGDTAGAMNAYVEYAAAYPDDPRAPVALDRAAQLRERLGDAAGAFQARLDLGARYPASAEGRAALHAAGLELLRAGSNVEARAAWQTMAEGNTGAWRARGAFWAGRAARAAGDEGAARELFAAARAAAPDGYEGARAADELGEAPAGTVPVGAPVEEAQWAELEAWATGLVPAAGAPAAPDIDGATARSALLGEVGLPNEALGEWLDALNAAGDEPAALLHVARGAHDAGVATVALRAAEQLLALAPEGAPPPPVALRRLLFPAPYAALVRREAAERGLDPRLLYALFRQESLFNPDATSWVGARGLAQVMPETGQGIAQNLGASDFTPDDLYRPAVSVRFGAFYLGQRVKDMSGSVQGALAAYNGGLGNAQRWADGSSVADPDLFVETIDYPETKGYVRAVYGFWRAYKDLYAGE
jgi:soluble lytic murein transglycosylase